MVLSRPHAKCTVCECVAWLQSSRERLRGTDSVSKQGRSLRYFVSRGVDFKKGREETCLSLGAQRSDRRKVLYLRESAQTKTSWPESEDGRPGNPMRGSSLQRVPGNEAEKPSVQIALRFDCRWIGQPVEGCPNNQQAQQTCRDRGAHSLVAPCIYPSGKNVAYGHWLRQQRHPLFLRCKKLYGR